MKKLLQIGLAILLIGSMLGGCGPKADKPTEKPEKKQQVEKM